MTKKSSAIQFYSVCLEKIHKEAERTYSYIFNKPDEINWQEGAHAHLAIDGFEPGRGKEGKKFVRHLSIQSLAQEGNLTFTTRIPLQCSFYKEELREAKIGDTFTLFKIGSNMTLRRENRPVILLSAGVGIATMRPLLKIFSENQENIEFLSHINVDSSGEFLFKEEIDAYAALTPSLENRYVATREDFYEALENGFEENAFYYLVGSDEFLIHVGKKLLAKGISLASIILDKKKEFYSELSS